MIKLRSSGRFPNSGGSVPFTLFGLMMMIATRCGVPAKPIPCQLDIAVDAFQFGVGSSPEGVFQSPEDFAVRDEACVRLIGYDGCGIAWMRLSEDVEQ